MKHISLSIVFLLILQGHLLVSCGSTDEELLPVPEPDSRPLKEISSFPVGAALSISKMKNIAGYSGLVKQEFNSITAENAMKMANLSPAQDRYSWDDADYFVDFAETNRMRIHGHCLVWHNSLPNWVANYQGTKEEWKSLLRDYIHTVVGRYKGKIASWDVVNEALLDDGTPRKTVWYNNIGWEYVALAFQYAHEADPGAVLFYNEYGQEYSKVKLKAINDSIVKLVKQGVPVHGIGLQMHTNINHSLDNLVDAIVVTSETGLKVHVSELDIALNPNKNTAYQPTEKDLNEQMKRYRIVAAAMMNIPAGQNWGITTWGLSDNDSWLTSIPDHPLLFDKEYQAKAAYEGVREALLRTDY